MLNKKQTLDFLLVLFLFILVGSLPLNLFISNEFILVTVQTILLIGFIVFMYFFSKKSTLNRSKKKLDLQAFWVLLPCFLACFSNYFYLLFNRDDALTLTFQSLDAVVYIKAVYIVLAAFTEEVIFRELLLGNLTYKSKLKKILISSAIFGGCHITVFLSSFNPADLINVVYTFGVGIILGFIYEYANSFGICIVFHILFNLMNDFVFSKVCAVSNFVSFIIINIIVSLIIGIYLLLVYIVMLNKKENTYEKVSK